MNMKPTTLFHILSFLLKTAHAAFSTNSPGKPFALNIKVEIKPDRREQFLELIKIDQEQTLSTEPGILQFVVGEDVETPNTFHLHEQYTSEEAYLAHTKTPHFAEWEKFCDSGPFGGEPILDFSQGTHNAETILLRPAFCLNVELCIKADVREEFLKVIQNNQDGSVKEPLCFQYHYGESTTTPNSFYFHEQYGGAEDGKEGFDAHVVAPHFVVWEEFASTNPFTKPPVVSKYKTL